MADAPAAELRPELRIDKLLWYLRFARSRSIAKAMAEKGHIRLNGRRVLKAHVPVRIGDVLTVALAHEVRVVTIVELPQHRLSAPLAALAVGPAPERPVPAPHTNG